MFEKKNTEVTENTEIAAVAAETTVEEVKKPMGQKLKEFGGKALGVAKKVLPVLGGVAAGVIGTVVVTKMASGDDADDDEYDEYEDDSDDTEE